jgi:hypothetical protein
MEIRPVIIGDRQQTERRDACVDTAL